jgi:hypothetical protein
MLGANSGVAAEVLDPAVMAETGKLWDGDDMRLVPLSVLRTSVDMVGFPDKILVGTWWTGASPSNVGLDALTLENGALGGAGMPVATAVDEVGVDAVDSINAFK